MIIFQCQESGCGHREIAYSGGEMRDLMAEHKRGHVQYREALVTGVSQRWDQVFASTVGHTYQTC